MVVRELERDAAALATKKQNDAGMLRVLDCFEQGVCFVDTAAAKWQGMHCNSALAEVCTRSPQVGCDGMTVLHLCMIETFSHVCPP